MAESAAAPEIRYPFFSMWLWPQAAIRRLITRSADVAGMALAAVAGIYVTILMIVFQAPGVGVSLHPAATDLIGAFAGIAALYAAAALMYLTGKLLGGAATQRDLRKALGWTAVPNSLALTLLAVVGLSLQMFGFFLSPSNRAEGDSVALFALMVLVSPLGLWGMFVSIRAIGAVQNFGFMRGFLNLALVCGALWYAVHALGQHLHARLPSFVMPNDAMMPSLAPFERFRLSSLVAPERGDVVVFARTRHHPHYGIITDYYVKRVIGLAGDEIAMSSGALSINGEAVKRERAADFAMDGANGQTKTVPRFREVLPNGVAYDVLDSDPNRSLGGSAHQVPADFCFVLGDNRDNADDSPDDYQGSQAPADSGFVRLDRLSGKALPKQGR